MTCSLSPMFPNRCWESSDYAAKRIKRSVQEPIEAQQYFTPAYLQENPEKFDVLSLTGGPLMIELCGGSARLTRALRWEGAEAVSVDWHRNRSKPVSLSIMLDITAAESQEIIIKVASSGRLVFLHVGPPCGTASRSREIPISAKRKAEGLFEPQPLRSDTFPEGLPTLAGTDKLKVDQANLIYEFTGRICALCHEKGILWSVENPLNSIMWLTKWLVSLLSLPGILRSKFPNCAHGG